MQVLTRPTHHYLQVINLRKTHPQKPEELPVVAATAVSAPAATCCPTWSTGMCWVYNRIACSLPELRTAFMNEHMHLHLH